MDTKLSIIRPPKVNERWSFQDYFGSAKVRMSFSRDDYKINPGLYAFGNAAETSEIFVTANYKLSFDVLRRELAGLNAWILVLDTKGINVWCAAGKGTFGTNELIKQINDSNVKNMVKHKRLILPQLGAPGVDANQVRLATGFNVKFGPVRASDIKEYLRAGYKKTEEMSTVRFNAIDRLKLVPVEFVNTLGKFFLLSIGFFILSGLSSRGYSFHESLGQGLMVVGILFFSYLSGAVITPLLLPWIPFKSFAAKGFILASVLMAPIPILLSRELSMLSIISLYMIGAAISSFLAMNFTGASTYTSLSGVRREMRVFVPIQALVSSLGFLVFIVSRFFNL